MFYTLGPMLPVAHCLIPQFPIQLELQRRGMTRPAVPLVLVSAADEGARVVARTADAGRLGVRLGQPLRIALAHCRDALYWTADPAWYEERHRAWLAQLHQVTPLLDDAGTGLGAVWLGLRGLERHFPDHAALAEELERLTRECLGLLPRIGLASGRFLARLAACRPEPAEREVPAGEEASFLAGCSIDVLPLDLEARRRLRRLGLHTLGDLAALPRSAVELQCGPAGGRAWDLARGADDPDVAPYQPPVLVRERARFPQPVTHFEFVLAALRRVLDRLLQRPEVRGRFVRKVVVRLALASGGTWERQMVFRTPLSDRDGILLALRPRLESLSSAGSDAIEEVECIVTDLCREPARQDRLLLESQAESSSLRDVLSQLNGRLGDAGVWSIVEVEPWSRVEERRHALVEYVP